MEEPEINKKTILLKNQLCRERSEKEKRFKKLTLELPKRTGESRRTEGLKLGGKDK